MSLASVSSNNFDTRSDVQQRSHEYKNFNEKQAVSNIPQEVFHYIFENINSDQDLMSIMFSCHNLSIRLKDYLTDRAVKAKKEIQQILDCTKLVDEKIVNLTKGNFHLIRSGLLNDLEVTSGNYRFFQFKYESWDSFLKNNYVLSPSFWNYHVAECYLDAVEAIAEYNIASELILEDVDLPTFRHQNFSEDSLLNSVNNPENRFINKIIFSENESAPIEFMLRKILCQAKKTLKGHAHHSCDTIINPTVYLGPCIVLGMYNPENAFWSVNRYQRFASEGDIFCGLDYPVKYLIGIREGDRICIMQGNVPVILRCFNRIYDFDRTFEHDLIKAVFRNVREYGTLPNSKDQINEIEKEVEKEFVRLRHVIKEVYSKKLVDTIQQEVIGTNLKIFARRKIYEIKRLFKK